MVVYNSLWPTILVLLINYLDMHAALSVCTSYMPLLGVHEMHGRMHPQLKSCNYFVGP